MVGTTPADSPKARRVAFHHSLAGAPVPGTDDGSDMSGMAGMGDPTGGMMSAQEISNLGNATGSAFDRMWLRMMVRHHQGAIAMAKTALAQGVDPDAKKLAKSVIDGQSFEIADMNSILTEIPG
jgi:uncharacterized protein (DUF305 family)